MSAQLFTNVVLGLVVVGYLAYRQMRWTRTDRTSVWKTPAILGIVGIAMLGSEASKLSITAVDIALVAFSLVSSIVIGLIMGRITHFRVASAPDEKGRTIESRTGGQGAALWIVMIALRVGTDVAGSMLGSQLITATGLIILSIGINRAASALMIDGRLPKTIHSMA
ncbi:hypothetical protein [Frondihabitans cladoniiphilus]|uniref:DUF1453 domain-containing protein n=1 Tax=Frondihabitans cladoniiphilus TaxID=715785 RepID=A0ABP8VXA4_9MICO